MQDSKRTVAANKPILNSTGALAESNHPNERCKILAKKGFLTLKNVTSGLAVLVYSQQFQLGVLFQLPASYGDPSAEFVSEDHLFAKSAMAMILAEFQSLGVRKQDLLTYAIGGSAVDEAAEASAEQVRTNLWSHGLTLTASDLGGHQVRSIWMDIENGRTIIRSEPIAAAAKTQSEPLAVAS